MILYSNNNSKSNKIEDMLKENGIEYQKVEILNHEIDCPVLRYGNRDYNYVQIMDMFTIVKG